MSETVLPTDLSGQTKRYAGNGRKLGYPTANLNVETNVADGVYFGYADLGKLQVRPALIFIGTPTTVGDKERRVEAHLLDIPDQDYYDQELTLEIKHFHRPNQTFKTIDELTVAMHGDEAAGRKWFTKNPAKEEK